MSWAAEIKTSGDADWVSNRIYFPDRNQAIAYGAALAMRCTGVVELRFVSTAERVNARWNIDRVEAA